jgi:hypothetical protein
VLVSLLYGAASWASPASAQNPPPPSHVLPPTIKPVQEPARASIARKRIERPTKRPPKKTRKNLD